MKGETKPFEAQAFLCTCNFGGIEIEINASGDGLRWRYNFGDDQNDPQLNTSIHEAEIIYDPDPDDPAGDFLAGFMINETFYSLSEFMRLDYGR